MSSFDGFSRIISIIGDQRVVVGRTSFSDMEFAANPSQRQREILVTRRYVQLVEQMDETARVPEWLAFASARQGIE